MMEKSTNHQFYIFLQLTAAVGPSNFYPVLFLIMFLLLLRKQMDFAASSPLFDRFYPYPILSIYKSICLTK